MGKRTPPKYRVSVRLSYGGKGWQVDEVEGHEAFALLGGPEKAAAAQQQLAGLMTDFLNACARNGEGLGVTIGNPAQPATGKGGEA